MITFRQLEIFLAVARAGSFRKCAEQLSVSQVSISEHIKALESRLECNLFERLPGGPATLTEAGHHAHNRLTAILTDLDDLFSELGGRTKGGKEQMVVSMHAFMMRNLHEPLRRFSQDHPNIDLRLDVDDHRVEDVLSRVARRELDMAYFYSFEHEFDIPTIYLRDEPLAIFVGAGHPLATKKDVVPSELRNYPAISLSPRNSLQCLVDIALERIGVRDVRVDIATDDYGLLLHRLRQDVGFACMFEATADEMHDGQGLVQVDLAVSLPAPRVRMATRRSSSQDTTLRRLSELIGIVDTSHKAKAETPA